MTTTDPTVRTETEFEDELRDLLDSTFEDDLSLFDVADVRSFSDAGILTNNRGLVVRLANGSEFQITIVQSDRPTDDEEV